VRRPLVRLLLAIPLTGLLLAGSLAAAWLALGSPEPASGATWFTVHKVGTEAHLADSPGQPFYLLALGNDGRTDADPGLGDAIHVIGVNPATGDASILDVPRDTEAPSGGKINAFHVSGGLPSTANQLNRMMGITISYAVTTNFPGFVEMVDEIGGVDIDVTEPMHDTDSGTAFDPGPYHMFGESLLAYARNRKSYPQEGDRMRTFNQGKAIIAALATLRAQNPGAAGTAKLTVTLARHVRTEGLDLGQMYELGRLALSIDPARIKNVVIPTGGGAGTNLSVAPQAQDLFADFRDDAILQNH
jgi:polyisoprenyl-teichoic acid--peptidoglycan teichoic acid transferase